MDVLRVNRNHILFEKHRGYHHPPGDITGELHLYGKDWVAAERRPLDITMYFPAGPKTISWHADIDSGISGGTSKKMKELRGHMHSFLCDFYGLDRVRFRFTIGDNVLAYEHEDEVHIECYLRLTFRVGVTVLPEEEGGAP